MSEDISKNTLLVLVVLTIIISLLGTFTVINEAVKVGSYDSEPLEKEGVTTGEVRINIVGPPEPVGATGQVTLKIIDIN